MMRKYERVVYYFMRSFSVSLLCLTFRFYCIFMNYFTFNYVQLELDRYSPIDASLSPFFGAAMTGLTFYSTSGVRVAGLAGTLGLGAVGATYMGYSLIGKPYGSFGYLFF